MYGNTVVKALEHVLDCIKPPNWISFTALRITAFKANVKDQTTFVAKLAVAIFCFKIKLRKFNQLFLHRSSLPWKRFHTFFDN